MTRLMTNKDTNKDCGFYNNSEHTSDDADDDEDEEMMNNVDQSSYQSELDDLTSPSTTGAVRPLHNNHQQQKVQRPHVAIRNYHHSHQTPPVKPLVVPPLQQHQNQQNQQQNVAIPIPIHGTSASSSSLLTTAPVSSSSPTMTTKTMRTGRFHVKEVISPTKPPLSPPNQHRTLSTRNHGHHHHNHHHQFMVKGNSGGSSSSCGGSSSSDEDCYRSQQQYHHNHHHVVGGGGTQQQVRRNSTSSSGNSTSGNTSGDHHHHHQQHHEREEMKSVQKQLKRLVYENEKQMKLIRALFVISQEQEHKQQRYRTSSHSSNGAAVSGARMGETVDEDGTRRIRAHSKETNANVNIGRSSDDTGSCTTSNTDGELLFVSQLVSQLSSEMNRLIQENGELRQQNDDLRKELSRLRRFSSGHPKKTVDTR